METGAARTVLVTVGEAVVDMLEVEAPGALGVDAVLVLVEDSAIDHTAEGLEAVVDDVAVALVSPPPHAVSERPVASIVAAMTGVRGSTWISEFGLACI